MSLWSPKALELFRTRTQNIRSRPHVIPLVPERAGSYFNQLVPVVTNLQSVLPQKLESGTVVLELNMASATSAFLQRLNRGSETTYNFIPSYRSVGVSANYAHQVLARLYPLLYLWSILQPFGIPRNITKKITTKKKMPRFFLDLNLSILFFCYIFYIKLFWLL